MQTHIKNWITKSSLLKTQLEQWASAVNHQDSKKITSLYHPKARLFPLNGMLKKGTHEVEAHFKENTLKKVTISYGTLSYNPDENLVEGEYTFIFTNNEAVNASFAFKFSQAGLIVEHASAPTNIKDWRLRNELSVCTLLTAATVKSVLKRGKALEAVA